MVVARRHSHGLECRWRLAAAPRALGLGVGVDLGVGVGVGVGMGVVGASWRAAVVRALVFVLENDAVVRATQRRLRLHVHQRGIHERRPCVLVVLVVLVLVVVLVVVLEVALAAVALAPSLALAEAVAVQVGAPLGVGDEVLSVVVVGSVLVVLVVLVALVVALMMSVVLVLVAVHGVLPAPQLPLHQLHAPQPVAQLGHSALKAGQRCAALALVLSSQPTAAASTAAAVPPARVHAAGHDEQKSK